MANRSDLIDPRMVEQLRTFGDGLAEGHSRPASNDTEATMLRAQRALGADRLAASAMPDSLKHTMWEDLMHTQPTTINPPLPLARQSPRTVAAAPAMLAPPVLAQRIVRSPLTRAVMRWQPAVSLAIVVAFLVGLVGIAYQRGIWNEPNPPEPSGAASQVMYDPDDASTFPEVPAQCGTNGPVESDAFYTDMSIEDRPQPEYTPVQAVTPEVGERIQHTYLRFLRCQDDAINDFPFPQATPTTYSDVLSPLALSYFSDRARLTMLYPTLSGTQQAEIDAQQCAGIGEILAGFPLPLNQPLDRALYSSTVDNLPNVLTLAFAPSDVYLLPDGRFGAIIGTVASASLIDPASATDSDLLTFVAFVDQDGRYLIDEEFIVFPGVADRAANAFFPASCGRHT